MSSLVQSRIAPKRPVLCCASHFIQFLQGFALTLAILNFECSPAPARCKGKAGTRVLCKLSSSTTADSEKPLVSSIC